MDEMLYLGTANDKIILSNCTKNMKPYRVGIKRLGVFTILPKDAASVPCFVFIPRKKVIIQIKKWICFGDSS